MKTWKILTLSGCFVGALSLLSGCGGTKTENINFSYVPTPDAPVKTTNFETQRMLTESAAQVEKSLNELSAIQMSLHPNVELQPPLDAKKAGLGQIVSLDWAGPIEDLLKQIANITDYKVRVLGVRPAIPVMVSISVQNVTVADILRNAMLQVVKKADITIFPTERVIELKYYPIT